MLVPSVLSWRTLSSKSIFRFLIASEITGWLAIAGLGLLVSASILESRESYSRGLLWVITLSVSVALVGLVGWVIWLMFRHLHHLKAINQYEG